MHRSAWFRAHLLPVYQVAVSARVLCFHVSRVSGHLSGLVTACIPYHGRPALRHSLYIRLGRHSRYQTGFVSCLAISRFSLRTGHLVACDRVATRRLRGCTAQRSYGRTPAPDVVCSAAFSSRVARSSAPARSATRNTRDFAWAAFPVWIGAAPRPFSNLATDRMVCNEYRVSRLACSGGLQLRTRARALARIRTRLFFGIVHLVLVSGHSAMASRGADSQLVYADLSCCRRPREHSTLRISCVLRPAGLQLLHHATESVPYITAVRSENRRGDHVGGWLDDLSVALCLCHREAPAAGDKTSRV